MKEIFVVQIEAAPDEIHHKSDEYGGAYVNVYTTELDIRKAIDIAEKEVVDAGWRVEKVVAATLSSEENFPDEDSGREYYEQSLEDGIVVVEHMFPPEHFESDFMH